MWPRNHPRSCRLRNEGRNATASHHGMRIGIDTHAAERDGTGNGSYIHGLVCALAALGGDDEYVLYGIHPHHRFYATLEPRAQLGVRGLRPRAARPRVPLAVGL